MKRSTVLTFLATCTLGLTFLAACSQSEEPTLSPTPSSTPTWVTTPVSPNTDSSTSPSETADEEQTKPSEFSTSIPSVAHTSGDYSHLFHDLRVGDHDSFYRVVAEFTGEGTMGYDASWEEKPSYDGSGEPIPVGKPTSLVVTVHGSLTPGSEAEIQQMYQGKDPLPLGPLVALDGGTFEGDTMLVIGMDKQRPVHLQWLENPTRLVIDVQK